MLLLLLLLTTTNKNTIKKINCYHFCLRAALRALTAKFSAGSYIHKVQSPHLQNKKRWGVHRQKVHRHKIQNHGAEQGSSKSTSQNKLTHTDTHRHTQTHTDTHMYICTYTYTHACTHTHTNTYTHTHMFHRYIALGARELWEQGDGGRERRCLCRRATRAAKRPPRAQKSRGPAFCFVGLGCTV